MTLSHRLTLINDLQQAERRHAPRAHIRRDLVLATLKQLRKELRWQWLARFIKPSERTVCLIGIAVGSIAYIVGVVGLMK